MERSRYKSPEEQKAELQAGVIVDALEKLEASTGYKVVGVGDIHVLPDGTVAGVVELSVKEFRGYQWFLFKGDTLIETIGGKEYRYVETLYLLPDGTLAGAVVLPDDRWFLFKGDTLIETIGGKEYRRVDVDHVHPFLDGTLAGLVQLPDGRWFLFKGDTLIETIGGQKYRYVLDVHPLPDGTLAGEVVLSGSVVFFWHMKRVVFFWDMKGRIIIREIN